MVIRQSTTQSHWHSSRRVRAAVLLEVVLALSLFVMTTSFVLTGLNASIKSVTQTRIEAEAADLAVTALSQVQMGLYEMVDTGPEAFDAQNLEAWTWQMIVTDLEDRQDLPQLKQVQIIIAHEQGYEHRLLHLVWDDPNKQQGTGETDGTQPEISGAPSGGALPGAGGLP